MISHRTSGLHSLLLLTQLFAALVLFAGLIPVFNAWRALANVERYALYAGVIAAALFIESLRRDRFTIRTCLYDRSIVKLHGIALRQALWVLGALVLFVALLKDATLSRLFLATYLIGLYFLLLATNRWLPQWLAVTIFRGKYERRMLLVGSNAKSPLLRAWLERKAMFGYRTVGILCAEKHSTHLQGIEVLGDPEEIESIIRKYQISQVIVLGLPVSPDPYHTFTDVCNRHGVRMMILSDLEEYLHHPAIHVEDDGLQFIAPRQEPLENPLNRILKRALDIAISLAVIVTVLPVIAGMVWLMQRFQSPGPLFFRQTRSGIQNFPFSIFKFRTMRNGNDAEDRQATQNDERVYPFGRFLRKYSLDELPQFLNVLSGEMSVVGPRPHLVEHNDKFVKLLGNYQIRTFVRPGITGLAQVRGFRGEATNTEAITSRLEADTYYLENWSLALDVAIIAHTVWHVMRPPKTAY